MALDIYWISEKKMSQQYSVQYDREAGFKPVLYFLKGSMTNWVKIEFIVKKKAAAYYNRDVILQAGKATKS